MRLRRYIRTWLLKADGHQLRSAHARQLPPGQLVDVRQLQAWITTCFRPLPCPSRCKFTHELAFSLQPPLRYHSCCLPSSMWSPPSGRDTPEHPCAQTRSHWFHDVIKLTMSQRLLLRVGETNWPSHPTSSPSQPCLATSIKVATRSTSFTGQHI